MSILNRFLRRRPSASEATSELRATVEHEGVQFFVAGDGSDLPLTEWYFHNRRLPEKVYATRVMLLRQMQAEALAQVQGDRVHIRIEDFYKLTGDELAALSIAPFLPHSPEVYCESEFSRADFRCLISYVDATGRPVQSLQRVGCVFRQDDRTWLIPPELYRLFQALERVNAAQTREDRLIAFAEVRQWLTAAGGTFRDEYLRGREVVVADSVRVDLTESPNGDLQLTPHLGTDYDKAVLRHVRRPGKVARGIDVVRAGRRRVTVVLREDVHLALREVKHCGRMRGAAKEAFLAQPSRFLSSAAVDKELLERQASQYRQPRYRAYIKSERDSEQVRLQLDSEQTQLTPGTATDLSLTREEARQLLTKVTQARADRRPQVEVSPEVTVTDLWSFERQLTDVLSPPADAAPAEAAPGIQLPGSLSSGVKLMPHQLQCLEWLQRLLQQDASGCLLADDMGLGKTLQVLTFFEWMRLSGQASGSSLLVAPIGLLETWRSEYFKFFAGPGGLDQKDLLFLFGKALQTFAPSGKLDTGAVARHPLVMTSYETLRSKAEEFRQIGWSLVVLDEAQKVKSAKTQVSQAVRSLDSKFRIASTGTPVENSLSDLWAIMDFASPGRLGSEREFLRTFNPEKESDYDQLAAKIEDLLGDRYLRRTKKDVLKDMPPKHEHFPSVQMSGVQRSQYLAVTAASKEMHPLDALSKLRQISCTSEGCSVAADFSGLACKLHWLLELLETIRASGEKALVFIEYKEVQRLIAAAVERHFQIPVSMINGDVSTMGTRTSKSRGELIADFQAAPGFGVLVLSPIAAGFGLTLTEANHVIHFLRHWNPAKEDQATDRAFRIGQNRPVHVYYPAALIDGTVSFDQRLGELLATKRKLATSAIFPSVFSKVEMEELFDVLQGTSQQPTARVRLEDIQATPKHLRLGVISALLATEGYLVEKLEGGIADLLARSSSAKSYVIKLLAPDDEGLDPAWVSTTYQRFCPTAVQALEVCFSGAVKSEAVMWLPKTIAEKLELHAVYWQDAYRPIRTFQPPPEERQLEAVETRLKSVWARRYDSVKITHEVAESSDDGAAEALFAASQWAINPSDELVLQLARFDKLPGFVKMINVSNGAWHFDVPAAALRHSSTYIEVTPGEGTYRVSAPGFEDDLDDELAPLSLSLEDWHPSVFRRDRFGFGRPLRARTLSTGGSYVLLIPPDFQAVPLPEGVTRRHYGSWCIDTLGVIQEQTSEFGSYLARLGLEARGRQPRLEMLGPRQNSGSFPTVRGRAILFSASSTGTGALALCDGVEVSQCHLEEGSELFFAAESLPSGGYVMSLTPQSPSEDIQTLGFEITAGLPNPPAAKWSVQLKEHQVPPGEVLSLEMVDELEIVAPAGWPFEVVAEMAGEARRWRGEWETPLLVGTILQELVITGDARENLEAVMLSFSGVGSYRYPIRAPQTVGGLRSRVRRCVQRHRNASYTGSLSLNEVYENLFRPVLEDLGHTPVTTEHQDGLILLQLPGGGLGGALLLPVHLDPSGPEARTACSALVGAGTSRYIVSNGLSWSLHGRFVKSPVSLEAALETEAAFEDFLAAFAAEGA